MAWCAGTSSGSLATWWVWHSDPSKFKNSDTCWRQGLQETLVFQTINSLLITWKWVSLEHPGSLIKTVHSCMVLSHSYQCELWMASSPTCSSLSEKFLPQHIQAFILGSVWCWKVSSEQKWVPKFGADSNQWDILLCVW